MELTMTIKTYNACGAAALLTGLLLATTSLAAPADSDAPLQLKPSARLGKGPAAENSGIVRSRTQSDVFWMHNDSGDEPRIYPVHRDGSVYRSVREPRTPGVLIGGAINVDWEDITVDNQGQVIVADFGNNPNNRRDLVLYYLNEPDATAERTGLKKSIFFRYPDQTEFPAGSEDFNYDAEAVFAVGDVVHVLTKHRSDTFSTLYRLDDPKPHVTNVLTRLASFDSGGRVTGADASPDGRRLVVITYERIWLFERDSLDSSFFEGRVLTRAYKAGDVEAVCFADDQTLILGDESRRVLYEVPIADLHPAATRPAVR
jgi:hypothetical protein